MTPKEVAAAFADAVARRDAVRLRSCLAADVRLRGLLPGGLEEAAGRDEAVATVLGWFDGVEAAEVAECTAEPVADRWRLSLRLRLTTDRGPEVVEQHGYFDAGPSGLEQVDLVCSGFRPEAAAGADRATVHRFDAGDMGCTDGLPQEFRRRIRSIPVGDVLEVVARDPSAKEDLPPLARMMGHTVLSVESLGDGRLRFTMERGK